MLFGKSLFESVLDRLATEHEEDEADETAACFRAPVFGGGLAGASHEETALQTGGFERGYLDALEGTEAPPPVLEEPVMPDHLLRLSPDEVAEDLDLQPTDTDLILNEKRRAFARLNHPDSMPEPFRDNANRRMTIANLMIDEALHRRHSAKH